MQAGRLRHRMAIQSATIANGATGQPVKTWSTDVTVWGSIEPLRGKEAEAQQQVQSEVTHRIMIRATSTTTAFTTDNRILFGSRVFDINDIRNWRERDVYLEIMATEQV